MRLPTGIFCFHSQLFKSIIPSLFSNPTVCIIIIMSCGQNVATNHSTHAIMQLQGFTSFMAPPAFVVYTHIALLLFPSVNRLLISSSGYATSCYLYLSSFFFFFIVRYCTVLLTRSV